MPAKDDPGRDGAATVTARDRGWSHRQALVGARGERVPRTLRKPNERLWWVDMVPGAEINIARIRQKVADIQEALSVLRAYAGLEDQAFLQDAEAIRSARYAFIVLVEAASNIANHLCARLLGRAPVSYADSFLMLGENGIVDAGVAARLAKMAGFRNLLVHRYGDVKNDRMLEMMRDDLGDVDEYLRAVGDVIRGRRPGT